MNDNMLFTKQCTIDNKGRLFLSTKNTGIKSGEKIYLFYSDERDCIIVRSEECIRNIGSQYNGCNPKEKEEKLVELGDFFFNCIGTTIVDKQGRINVGVEACSEVNIVGSAFAIGCFDEVRLYSSADVYRASIIAKRENKLKTLGSLL